MALTAQQIQLLLQQARESGLSDAEIEGMRAVLMTRTLDLTAAEKLSMAINTLPTDQRENATAFVDEADAISDRVTARGRAALEALSDDEWQRLVDEANNDVT